MWLFYAIAMLYFAYDNNPQCQVIVNTHSPVVVQQLPEDTLLVAELQERIVEGQPVQSVTFGCLPETWRANAGVPTVPLGKVLAYLNPSYAILCTACRSHKIGSD